MGPHYNNIRFLQISHNQQRRHSSPHITMTSWWAWRCLKSPASRLFTQSFIQAQIKENIKAPRHWPLCMEFTGDRGIPRTKGQLRGKCFHLMTSSWAVRYDVPLRVQCICYLKVRLHGRRQAARLARDMLQRDLLRGNSVYMVGSCRARLLHVKPCSVTRDRRHATGDSRHILSVVARQKINVCSVTCDTINSFHTKMTSIELLQDELIIASAAFIMYQYSANQKENGDGSSTLYINKDRHVGHLCHLAEWVVSLFAKRLNNKSWTVHPNITIRREGHRKIQVRDLYLVQMVSQCGATSRKSRHRSLHVAIPNVAGDTSLVASNWTHTKKYVCSE